MDITTNQDQTNNSEYIEDPYFNLQDSTTTPSLDEILDGEDGLFDILDVDPQLDIDLFDFSLINEHLVSIESPDDSLNIETEFYSGQTNNSGIKKYLQFFRKDGKRQVRVIYSDLTKPFMAKMPNNENFRNYLEFTSEEAYGAGDNPLAGMDAQEAERQRAIWEAELATLDEEISTLRAVLASKVRDSAELKRKLGISVWRELSEDVNQGLKNVKDSSVFQKTSGILSGLTGTVSTKIGQMRHSESFRSIEEKMGSAIDNVRTKVSTSRSNSIQSLDDALSQHQGSGSARSSIPTSPSIPEGKPLA